MNTWLKFPVDWKICFERMQDIGGKIKIEAERIKIFG